MANRKLLSTVYPGISTSPDAHRLNPQVSSADCGTIISASGDTHILSHICQLAIKTTADYVRTRNITFATRDQLSEFLRERSPFTPAPTEAVAHDVTGRDSRGGEQAENAAHGESVPRTRVEAGRGGEKGKGSAGRKRGTGKVGKS